MRVLIVGGGSAGWIAASTLQAALNGTGPGPVSITVLEDPATPRIGVGEATIPTVRDMLRRFGWAERDFMRSCEATFKHAIRFDGWRGTGSSYLHPFHRRGGPGWHTASGHWLGTDQGVPFSDLVSAQGTLIAQGVAPRALDADDYTGAVPYAYHMDAEMFADALARRCGGQGVQHIRARMMRADRNAQGHVSAVVLDDGQRLQADLYVDCTGFRALLSRETPGYAWVDQSEHLLCDRAVTLRIPEDPAQFVAPAVTRARALSAGWCWDIGLRSRRGRGYVYASRHLSAEDADAELRAEEGLRAHGIEARHLAFSVGRQASPWSGNVVALGLAAGFLEPLESTGLYLADTGARMLAEMFPPAPHLATAEPLVERFNTVMAELHDDILTFVALHYAVADRPEPFWRDAADPKRHTVRLAHLLALWRIRAPVLADFSLRFTPFGVTSYEFILFGSDWAKAPAGAPPMSPALVARLTADTQRLAKGLPSIAKALATL